MKKIIVFVLFFNLTIFSQIKFEKGYLIDNSNTKIECLIKNYDWNYNPDEIEYKLDENTQVNIISSKKIKEFVIENEVKYISAKVKIDRSSEDLNNLSKERNPVFQEEELLLKVLVEGKSCLYKYAEPSLLRFFFKADDSNITQLIYKTYQNEQDFVTLQNNTFKQQLLKTIQCNDCKTKDFEYLEYKSKSLEKIFKKYNADFYQDSTNFSKEGKDKKEEKDILNLSIKAGLNSSHLQQISKNGTYSIKLENKTNLAVGLELETIFGFNKNKWSAYIEPTYQSYNSKNISDHKYLSGEKLVTSFKYQSIEVPIGARHYMFINKNSKLFVNIEYIIDFSLKSEFLRTTIDGSQISYYKNLKSGRNFGLGLGYKFKNKFSFEMAYQTSRDLTNNFLSIESNYKKISFVLGYTLF